MIECLNAHLGIQLFLSDYQSSHAISHLIILLWIYTQLIYLRSHQGFGR